MPILVSDIRSRLEEPRDSIVEKALLKLGTSRSAVRKAAVSKTSVEIFFSCNFLLHDSQFVCLNNSRVGRNNVTGREKYNVSEDNLSAV